jgi:peptidoglycan/xylan/chitin deacetylase (PgdA/CDA1 family)
MPPRERARDLALATMETGAARAVLALAERIDRGSPDRFVALTYHRIDDGTGAPTPPGSVSATPTDFERQMELVARTCTPISVDDLLQARRGTGRLPRRAVLVTFDDAYRDFSTWAWPTLHRLGIPVTMFVPTGFPGTEHRFWWDRVWGGVQEAVSGVELEVGVETFRVEGPVSREANYRAVRREVKRMAHPAAMAYVDDVVARLGVPSNAGLPEVLTWDELRVLAGQGVTLAPHSRTHAMLDQVPVDQILEEIAGSIDDLRRETGDSAPVFAYPSGQHDDQAVAVAREAGIELAFTTRRGGGALTKGDPLLLPRVNVGRRTSPDVLRAQLLPTVARASARWSAG